MRRFLLDTGIAGLFVSERKGIRERAKQETGRGNVVGIGLPVLAELEYGASFSKDPERSIKRLRRALSLLRVWPLTLESVAEFGRISAEMKRNGHNIGQIDRLNAGIALALSNCTVVSADTDMLLVPGLSVENCMNRRSDLALTS